MDETFQAEQRHLSETYATLVELRDELTQDIEVRHKGIAKDLADMAEEVSLDFVGLDETMETLAAVETLNAVIDAYNQYHDAAIAKLQRVYLLLSQPYFAKVRLIMRPGRPPRDVYIGTAGVTTQDGTPLIVDWRNPIAETYYNQEMGMTSYKVNDRVRTVELTLRRQYDIVRDQLRMYFDTTVAIQDSLLLGALKRHHTEKLQAITATIQREQNQIVRHDDVPALLVNGIAGSGKTSVMLQRIAFLLYRQRDTLDASQVYLFTPNTVFASYISSVLPSLGERNPRTFTWDSFLAELGLSERSSGADGGSASLEVLEAAVPTLELEEEDLRGISVGDVQLLKASQVKAAVKKFSRFPVGRRFSALVKDDLHARLERRFAQLAANDEVQEEMLSLDLDEQVELFGHTIDMPDVQETLALTQTYVEHLYGSAHDAIEAATWLRIDRIGMRILGRSSISAAEWLYLSMLITGVDGRNARYVMIDEVQDYTTTQLMVLARYFSRAHFLLLGDEHQAIREGTASFAEAKQIFATTHGQLEECLLRTSYRSSPEITELFASLLDAGERMSLSSVRRPGRAPVIVSCDDVDGYLETLRSLVAQASTEEGLTAIIAHDRERARWIARKLGEGVKRVHRGDKLPAQGVIVLDLGLAKGLEFDQVIIPDAQESVYPATDLARRQLYTAISRAMHQVSVVSQGAMTPLLKARA